MVTNMHTHPSHTLYRKPAEEPEEPGSILDDATEDNSSVADVKDLKEYEEVFKPNHKLGKWYMFVYLFTCTYKSS